MKTKQSKTEKYDDKRIVELNASEIAKQSLLEQLINIRINPYTYYREAMFKSSIALFNSFDKNFLNSIEEFAEEKFENSVLVLRNLPVSFDGLPPTPRNDKNANGKDYFSELFLLGLAQLLSCYPFINVGEKNDSMFQHVIPVEGDEHKTSGTGSSVIFDFHSENMHQAAPPDFFFLFCLRGDPNAVTTYIPVDDIVCDLPEDIIKMLSRKEFVFKTGESYTQEFSYINCVLSKSTKGHWEMRYNSSADRLCGLTEEANKACTFLRNWIKQKVEIRGICLQPGDCLVINNKRALHGRTGFIMHPDVNQRRWLMRLYLKRIIAE